MSSRARSRRRFLFKLALLGITTTVMLLLGEAVVRWISGYAVFSWNLRRTSNAVASRDDQDLVDEFLRRHAAREDLDGAWLRSSPPPIPTFPVDPDLQARLDRYREKIFLYLVNEVLLRAMWVPGTGVSIFKDIEQPDSYRVFTPPDGQPAPRFRYPPSTTLPTGLTTNSFGFRGREVTVDKPPRTVRIACVGASTTVNEHRYPHSYPELLEHWLLLWAERQGLEVRFEVLNAGREAIVSPDIRAIVKHEVLPLAVDYVVYYEGANQLRPPDVDKHTRVEGEYQLATPPAGLVPAITGERDATWLDQLCGISAIAERTRSLLESGARLTEPEKPAQEVVLPEGVDEQEPDLATAGQVLNVAQILADLDGIRELLAEQRAQLLLCSFCWFAKDGLELHPVWNRNTYVQLNRAYWPFRYGVMRRMADLQNRYLERWAAARGVDFIDVAGGMPVDERLYTDALHNFEIGVRLRAWLVLEKLTQVIERDLGRGAVPVPDPRPDAKHPHIGPGRVLTAKELDGR